MTVEQWVTCLQYLSTTSKPKSGYSISEYVLWRKFLPRAGEVASRKQVRLRLPQTISTNGQSHVDALFANSLNNHASTNCFSNHDDITCQRLRPADVGSHVARGGCPMCHSVNHSPSRRHCVRADQNRIFGLIPNCSARHPLCSATKYKSPNICCFPS